MFLIRWLIKLTGIIPGFMALNAKKYFIREKINTTAYRGPLIIVQNHKGFMDFPIIVRMFALRRVHVVVSELLYGSSGFLRFILKAMGVIKADRFSGDPSFINKSIEVLKKGGIVLIYPEGKIETGNEIHEFKRSAALISIQSGVPILPIYHNGKIGFFKRDKCFIGGLMYPQEYAAEGCTLAENADRFNKALRDNIYSYQQMYQNSFFTDGTKKAPADKMNFAGRFVRATALPPISLLLRPKVTYESGYAKLMRSHQKRVIIISNHTWWLDGPVHYWLFKKRLPHCIAARDVAEKNSFVCKLQKNVGCILLDRSGFDWASMKSCIEVLEKEGALIIFPEGRFNMDGNIAEFHTGPAMLSALTGAPVVPAYIDGIYKPFKRVGVYMGEPVFLKEFYEKEGINSDTVAEATAVLYDKVMALRSISEAQESSSDRELRLELERQHAEKLKAGG